MNVWTNFISSIKRVSEDFDLWKLQTWESEKPPGDRERKFHEFTKSINVTIAVVGEVE